MTTYNISNNSFQYPQQHFLHHSHTHAQPSGPQRYVNVDPGRQQYINPAFIHSNQNYYTSPVIQTPPLPNSYPTNYDPYANYYNYYNHYYQNNPCVCRDSYGQAYPYYGAPMAPYPAFNQYNCQPCAGYPQQQYTQTNCGCNNCAEYGLPFINRQRITPKFPQKLGHSFVTSGDQVQNKMVINQPTSQSAPFQTQRRKTYKPYTRKYIEYQDYIQYVPVQRSEWIYKKVMKQIDFVPKQYYETSVERVPREKLNYKLQYVPIEKEFVHFPKDVLDPPKPSVQQSDIRLQLIGTQTTNPNSAIRPDIHFSHRNTIPLHSSKIIRDTNTSQLQNRVLRTIYQQNSSSPNIIIPVESKAQLIQVQNFNQDSIQRSGAFGVFNKQNTNNYRSNEVFRIAQSNQTNIAQQNPAFSSFGRRNENYGHNNVNNRGNVEGSQVLHSAYGGHRLESNVNITHIETQKQVSYTRNFRQSGQVQSEDFNFDPSDLFKKQTLASRFEDEAK